MILWRRMLKDIEGLRMKFSDGVLEYYVISKVNAKVSAANDHTSCWAHLIVRVYYVPGE
jgi:hypothetical protein